MEFDQENVAKPLLFICRFSGLTHWESIGKPLGNQWVRHLPSTLSWWLTVTVISPVASLNFTKCRVTSAGLSGCSAQKQRIGSIPRPLLLLKSSVFRRNTSVFVFSIVIKKHEVSSNILSIYIYIYYSYPHEDISLNILLRIVMSYVYIHTYISSRLKYKSTSIRSLTHYTFSALLLFF